MSCEFAHDDGAYVLGALSPTERVAFKQHLATCEECTRSVAALAGLPGLLGRVDASVLEEPPADERAAVAAAPPCSGRYVVSGAGALTAVGLAAAAAVVAAAVPIGLAQLGDEPPAPGRSERRPSPRSRWRSLPMDTIGEVPVRATVSLEEVTWGTRLGLTCTYDPASVEYDLPPEADYEIFVTTHSGRVEQVGSWRSVSGREMEIMAATAAHDRGASVGGGPDRRRPRGATPGDLTAAGVAEQEQPRRRVAATSAPAAVHTYQPSHDSSRPNSPTVVGQDEPTERRQHRPDCQERRDPVGTTPAAAPRSSPHRPRSAGRAARSCRRPCSRRPRGTGAPPAETSTATAASTRVPMATPFVGIAPTTVAERCHPG